MPNEDEIHLWEFPPETTYLLLEREFQKVKVDEAVSKQGSMKALSTYLNQTAEGYGIFSRYGAGNICDWKKGRMIHGQRRHIWIPLWVVMEIEKLTNENEDERLKNLEEIESRTTSYKGLETGTPITNPKLPIKVTPEFDSIVFHLMGDGCWGGKGKLSSYRQKNKQGRDQFVQKLHNVFGCFEINQYESECEWKVCIPSHLVRIIEKYYGLETPESRRRVPAQIMEKHWHHKIAGLAAFLVDEGNVGDSIDIYASNKPLLEDLQKICEERDYSSKVVLKASAGYRSHTIDHYRLRIGLESVEKLHKDLQDIAQIYPACTLAQKQKRFEMIVARRSLHRKKGENGAVKKQILMLLATGPKNVNEMKEELLIGGQTIREHLHQLKKGNKIERVGRIGNGEIWNLTQKSDSLF